MRQNDFYLAKEAIRRFHDYSLPSQQGQHQHALLGLAATHAAEGLHPLAKRTVNEAIRIARSHGDRACLDHCVRLSDEIDKAQKEKRERERREDEMPEDYPKVSMQAGELMADCDGLGRAQKTCQRDARHHLAWIGRQRKATATVACGPGHAVAQARHNALV